MQTPIRYVVFLLAALLFVVGCDLATALNPAAIATSPALTETSAPTFAAALPTATLTATPTITPTVSHASVDPLQAIANSLHSFGAITSYHMSIVIQGGPASGQGTDNIDIAGKEYHYASSKGTEFYLIGSTFYLKQSANAQWRKFPANSVEATGATTALLAPRETLTNAITAHNATLSGTDIVDGKPMLVYQYTLNNAPAKLWVGAADGLPYQAEGVSKNGAQVTLTISNYNVPIVFTPPVP